MTTVFITVPRGDAEAMATRLVEERLAACVNRIDCRSTYRWDDAVQTDDEAILLAKTTDGTYEALVDRVRGLHPYDVPCIERFDESALHPPFARWRSAAVE